MNIKFLLSLLIITGSLQAAGQDVYGIVTDTKKEALVNASVVVKQNGIIKGGGVTDFDGVYKLKLTDTGSFEIEVKYEGYLSQKTTKMIVAGKQTIANFFLTQSTYFIQTDYSRGCGWKNSLINKK